MALIRMTGRDDKAPAVFAQQQDRIPPAYHEPDTGRSNFVAFVLGGTVIATSMLGFLYYDSGRTDRFDGLSTGSISQPAPTVPILPSVREDNTGGVEP